MTVERVLFDKEIFMFNLIPDEILDGNPVKIISRGYYVQKKNSRNRLLNFVYRILFGNEFVYEIKTGEILQFGNCLCMNPFTFKELKSKYETQKI